MFLWTSGVGNHQLFTGLPCNAPAGTPTRGICVHCSPGLSISTCGGSHKGWVKPTQFIEFTTARINAWLAARFDVMEQRVLTNAVDRWSSRFGMYHNYVFFSTVQGHLTSRIAYANGIVLRPSHCRENWILCWLRQSPQRLSYYRPLTLNCFITFGTVCSFLFPLVRWSQPACVLSCTYSSTL